MTIGAYAGDSGALPWIALERGYLRESGLEATVLPFKAGKFAVQALERGEVEVATAADIVIAKAAFRHTDMRIVAALTFSNTNNVIGRRDRQIDQPADLKGKRLGLTRGTSGEFLGAHFLLRHGLTMSDMEIVHLKPPALMTAIGKGGIDAVSTWGKYAFTIKKRLGDNARFFPHDPSQGFFFVLLAKEPWLKKNGERLERLLRALRLAVELVKRRPDEAKRLIAARFQFDADYMKHIWPRHDFRLDLPQALLLSLEEQGQWLIENRLVTGQRVPNMLNVIHTGPMRAIHPQAVTIAK